MPARKRRPERGFSASPLRNLIGGVLFVLTVCAVAVIGYVSQGWRLGDAIYMTVLTVYTVGYDEVDPIVTPQLRGITIGLIVFGCTGMIFLTGALVQLITVRSFQEVLGTRRARSQMEKLENHTIICGYGRIGKMLARDLAAASAPFVVIEANPARGAEATADGYLIVAEDATEEQALIHAGIARARVLVTVVPNDAANVFITLSARSLNPNLQIIARGEAPSTERKLLQAGANNVVLPAHIGADRMAELILYPATVDMVRSSGRMREMEQDLHRLGLDLETLVVADGCQHEGRTVQAVERELGLFIVAIEQPGTGEAARPAPTRILKAGDGVTVLGRHGGTPLAAGFTAI